MITFANIKVQVSSF